MRALPSISDLPTLASPSVLVWIYAEDEAHDTWQAALSGLGWLPGRDYDLYLRGRLPEPAPELARYGITRPRALSRQAARGR